MEAGQEGGRADGAQAATTAGAGGSLPLRLDADVQASPPWPGLIIVLSKVAKPPFPGASFFFQETRKNDQCKNLHNLNHRLPHFLMQDG